MSELFQEKYIRILIYWCLTIIYYIFSHNIIIVVCKYIISTLQFKCMTFPKVRFRRKKIDKKLYLL